MLSISTYCVAAILGLNTLRNSDKAEEFITTGPVSPFSPRGPLLPGPPWNEKHTPWSYPESGRLPGSQRFPTMSFVVIDQAGSAAIIISDVNKAGSLIEQRKQNWTRLKLRKHPHSVQLYTTGQHSFNWSIMQLWSCCRLEGGVTVYRGAGGAWGSRAGRRAGAGVGEGRTLQLVPLRVTERGREAWEARECRLCWVVWWGGIRMCHEGGGH